MADSDDEYDRRRGRDKFRRERNDYDRRDERRRDSWDHDRARSASTRSRDVWSSRSRDSSKRDSYGRDYESRRRDRYSPPRHDMSPPQMKRMRRDWDDTGVNSGAGVGIVGGGGVAGGVGIVGVGAAGVGRFDMPFNTGAGQLHGTGLPHPNWGAGLEMNLPPQNQPHYGNNPSQNRMEPDYPTQPPMLTFKLFLSQQDDSISDQDAIKKYNEYKMEFKKGQITEFFLAHKDEEWFKYKYHPEECSKRQEEQNAALRRRLQIFLELMAHGRVDSCSVDIEKCDELIKLLDAAVIKLEGGDDTDLKILDEPESPEKEENIRSRNNSESLPHVEKKIEEEADKTNVLKHSKSSEDVPASNDKKKENVETKEETKEEEEKQQSDKLLELPINKEQEELQKQAQEFSKQQQNQPDDDNGEEQDRETKGKKKRHRDKTEYSYETGSESESGSDSDSEPEPAPPGVDDPPEASAENSPAAIAEGDEKVEEAKEEDGEAKIKEKSDEEDADEEKQKSEAGDDDDDDDDDEDDDDDKEEGEEKEDAENITGKETDKSDEKEKDVDMAEEESPEKSNGSQAPRALHKTCSIFLRNLAPSITKQEVVATCRRYPGFMRVALQDPQPERRFFRRGWVTFERNVNIKDICWNLNNIRLRDCELGAIVNRELKQRVRPVHGITAHKPIVKQDIKLTAKIIQNLDLKWKLWEDSGEEKKDEEKQSYGLVSKNPVLKNITDYLVEEGSYEEEELLGESVDDKDKPKEGMQEVTLERDSTLISVLDRMILYLRVVHSLDYYSASEYPNEDEMPHRCGIIHVRGPPPMKITQNDVTEWMNNFETKLKHFLELQALLNKDEANQLGRKDPDVEVEKFVTSNTQELTEDKWMCPLSGKKFKGPDYVKKHIFNKHGEKIEEVKKEVSFFNNYLLDPKRPQLPEHPGNKQSGPSTSSGQRESLLGPVNASAFQGLPQMLAYNQPRPPLLYAGPPAPYGASNYARDNYRLDYRRGGGGGGYKPFRRPDPRSIIEYKDLDAPEDVDIF